MSWPNDRNLDQQRIEQKRKAKKVLDFLVETGDEEGYVALVKEMRPNLTPAELVDLIQQFRDRRRGR